MLGVAAIFFEVIRVVGVALWMFGDSFAAAVVGISGLVAGG